MASLRVRENTMKLANISKTEISPELSLNLCFLTEADLGVQHFHHHAH